MAQERRVRCSEVACGHSRSSHMNDGNHACTVCTCQAFEETPEKGNIPEQRAGDMPGPSVVISEVGLTQLRSKLEVYETRNETQVRTIETQKRELNQKDGEINGLTLANEVADRVITELKQELGATRFLVSLMVDSGHLPENFARTFLPAMPPVGHDDEDGYFDGENGPVAVAFIIDED